MALSGKPPVGVDFLLGHCHREPSLMALIVPSEIRRWTPGRETPTMMATSAGEDEMS